MMPDLDMFWMSGALDSPEECTEEVSWGGILQPCNKTAVALRFDPEEARPYPVCAHHARGEMVTLKQIAQFFLDRAETQQRATGGLVQFATKARIIGCGADGQPSQTSEYVTRSTPAKKGPGS